MTSLFQRNRENQTRGNSSRTLQGEQTLNSNFQMSKTLIVLNFVLWSFEFVSNFGFRASDFFYSYGSKLLPPGEISYQGSIQADGGIKERIIDEVRGAGFSVCVDQCVNRFQISRPDGMGVCKKF